MAVNFAKSRRRFHLILVVAYRHQAAVGDPPDHARSGLHLVVIVVEHLGGGIHHEARGLIGIDRLAGDDRETHAALA